MAEYQLDPVAVAEFRALFDLVGHTPLRRLLDRQGLSKLRNVPTGLQLRWVHNALELLAHG